MTFDAAGPRVGIRRPVESDRAQFIHEAQASTSFLHPWVEAPPPERFDRYLKARQGEAEDGYFICALDSGQIVGVINLNCIVRASFQSAYLGYYIFAPFARQGFMTEGLQLAVRHAFERLNLHRLEANIQPENTASIALVRKCGFRKEGFSPRYLRVLREWKDHERWARLADE